MSEWTEINPRDLEEGDSFVCSDGAQGVVAEKAEDGLYVSWLGEDANRPVSSLVTWSELEEGVSIYA